MEENDSNQKRNLYLQSAIMQARYHILLNDCAKYSGTDGQKCIIYINLNFASNQQRNAI